MVVIAASEATPSLVHYRDKLTADALDDSGAAVDETRVELDGRGRRPLSAAQASSPVKMPPHALMATSSPTSAPTSETILSVSSKTDFPLSPPTPVGSRESAVGLLFATVSASTPLSLHSLASASTVSRDSSCGPASPSG